MANNRKTETLGVSYLSTFIDKHELLQSYFESNDKTPVWDGEIHVLKSPSEKKDEILGKVPVQIKTTRQKKDVLKSFSLDTRDLELYKPNGGVVLFVVWLNEDNGLRDIYYKSLPPLSIKNLLKKSKLKNKSTNRKKLSIEIFKLDEKKMYPMLVDFINNSQKQYSFINVEGISVEDIPDDKTLKFYFYGQEKEEIFNYQEEHDLFIYYLDPITGIEIPLENTIKIVETEEETDLIIKIGDYVFQDVKRHRFPDGSVQLHFGESFTMSFDIKKKQFKFNYTRPDLLSKAIKCTQVFQELGKIGYFTLNGNKIELDERSIKDISSLDLEADIKGLLKISNFMKKMGIQKDVDLSFFDKQSQRNLNILYSGLVLKKKVALNYNESKLLHLNIANIHIITLYSFLSDKNGTMIDIFTETPWCREGETEDEDYLDISIFEVFEPNDWLKIDNCKIDSVIASYQRLVDNKLKYEGADRTILKIVIAADMAEDKTKRELLLNWAQCLSDWNLKYSKNCEMAIINDLQIKSRVRKLNSKETETLTNILVNSNDNYELCFGSSVLLKSKPQADLFWNKLDNETKERYKDFPIYTLYMKLS
ncbi:Lmo0466 protein [Streptococcus pneumoniae]|nr:Lmo0466 protein [Streptococcus pneumoniae]VLR60196.1 Lmo0466 protein [Streptococcus pneumoniae]VLS52807.1 Lmo0466 protein [Streptococcus pneumoniae]VOX70597.1 Lmo0466 protein [Streptococcus pneumoniae]VOY26869.1 Lmo0466 protein [Streptococcus pneumoniae]